MTLALDLGVSDKRLLGWEPVEVHEHEYEDGFLVRTVVTREPEWDDLERSKMQALAQYRLETCKCGLHISVAESDPDLEITVRMCPTCDGIAKAHRAIDAKDDAAIRALGDKPRPSDHRPTDGRHLGLKFKT